MRTRLIASPEGGRGGVQEIGRVLAGGQRGSSRSGESMLVEGLREILLTRWRMNGYPSRHALTWKTAVAATFPKAASGWLVWAHGADLYRDHGLWQPIRRRVLESAAAVLGSTPYAVQALRQEGIRAYLIGPPITIGTEPTDGATGRRERAGPTLISVGRFLPRKGHDTAIQVTQHLRRQGVDATLDIVGDGPDLPRLLHLAEDQPWIRIHVNPDNDVRDRLLADADLLLFLTRSEGKEFEGLGMVALEAAAAGVPSVVSRSGGSEHGVIDGSSGVLVGSEPTVDELAAAVHHAVRRRDILSEGALAFAANFSMAKWWERVRAVESGVDPRWEWPR
jgi:glycosyltransferase involved in cell wall biosynthesis